MNEDMKTVVAESELQEATMRKYVVGFVGSLAITIVAYLLANGNLNKNITVALLAILAVGQFVVQMVLFLHVGAERRPRWKLAVMAMMLAVVLILVGGSLWIMNNLNYRMMHSPAEQRKYLQSQDAL